jgi:hypothetical protein
MMFGLAAVIASLPSGPVDRSRSLSQAITLYLSAMFELGGSAVGWKSLKYLKSLALPRGLEPLFSP